MQIINHEKQSASTAGWIKAACSGKFDAVNMIPPREPFHPFTIFALNLRILFPQNTSSM